MFTEEQNVEEEEEEKESNLINLKRKAHLAVAWRRRGAAL